MTLSTSNILAFPISRSLPVALPSPEPSLVGSVERHISREEHAAYDAHVATVVRASIGFARRRGIYLDSLPPQLRTWLFDLCEKGDPTCKMVRDWLTGNQRYCMHLAEEDV